MVRHTNAKNKRDLDWLERFYQETETGGFVPPYTVLLFAAQLRQPIKNSLVLSHLKTLRLYTGIFKFELDHYLTNVARVKSRYWG